MDGPEFPKMMCGSDGRFADEDAVNAAVASGDIQLLVVNSAAEQAAALADGWVLSRAELIGDPKPSKRRKEAP